MPSKRIAILATDRFEQGELVEPQQALIKAGHQTSIIAPHGGELVAAHHTETGDTFSIDLTLDAAKASDFDALLLPGGAMNADKLRMDEQARDFARDMDKAGKPIAVICHAPWLLISSGLVKGRRLTSYYTLQDDIRNAGGTWSDEAVVHDRNWVSSRQPRDIPAFNKSFLELLSKS